MTPEELDEVFTRSTVGLRKALRVEILVTMALVHKPEGGWLRMLRVSSSPESYGTYKQLAGILRDAADDLEKVNREEEN